MDDNLSSDFGDAKNYAPVLHFGSSPKDASLLGPVPPIAEMPFPKMISCFAKFSIRHHYQNDNPNQNNFGRCILGDQFWTDVIREENRPPFDQLIPTIIWRGLEVADESRDDDDGDAGLKRGYHDEMNMVFTDNNPQMAYNSLMSQWNALTPRWKAVTLSLGAALHYQRFGGGGDDGDANAANNGDDDLPWIDSKFFYDETKINDEDNNNNSDDNDNDNHRLAHFFTMEPTIVTTKKISKCTTNVL
uniref:Uncharacterized protein n=2 Tax=Ditylum brightwellii TaxID=49249 RepID=A0A7S4QKX3_9STRA